MMDILRFIAWAVGMLALAFGEPDWKFVGVIIFIAAVVYVSVTPYLRKR